MWHKGPPVPRKQCDSDGKEFVASRLQPQKCCHRVAPETPRWHDSEQCLHGVPSKGDQRAGDGCGMCGVSRGFLFRVLERCTTW